MFSTDPIFFEGCIVHQWVRDGSYILVQVWYNEKG